MAVTLSERTSGQRLLDDELFHGKGELAGAPVEGFVTERLMFRRIDRPPSRATLEFVVWIENAVKHVMKQRKTMFREIDSYAGWLGHPRKIVASDCRLTV